MKPQDYFTGQDFDLFLDEVQPDDIDQGELGNCWFLSALSALAEHNECIKRIFLNTEKSNYACYCVLLFLNGMWEEVIIDDNFPAINRSNWKFSQCTSNEFWVQLVEKAYAKAMGGYANLSAWHTTEAFNNLTGAPSDYFLTDWEFHREKILPIIKMALENGFPVAVSTFHKKEREYVGSNGLVYGHAYTLLDYAELTELSDGSFRETRYNDPEGSVHKLIKLRNPWAKIGWNGAWSDNSSEMKRAKHLFDEDYDQNAGVFHISLNDFYENFASVKVCYYHPGFVHSCVRTMLCRDVVKFHFQIKTKGLYYAVVTEECSLKYAKSESKSRN